MCKQWRMAVLFVLATSWQTAQAFNDYEHSEIGDAAFASAIAGLEQAAPGSAAKLFATPHLSSVTPAAGKRAEPICAVAGGKDLVCFSFGDLVAIYGDFAETFAEVNNPAIVQRAATLKEIVGGRRHYTAFASEKKHVMELAAHNATHFSMGAAQAYVQWHGQALTLAAQPGRLWEALHYEALALHSLTDLFALGHMLEDRERTDQLVKWARKNNTALSAAVAKGGSSAMGGLVNFYHNAFNFRGAMVKNLAGESWRAYGDGKYRIVDAACARKSYIERRACVDVATKAQRDIIVNAAAKSLSGVLARATGKSLPAGTEYAALAHVPIEFKDTQEPLHPEHQIPQIARLAIAMKSQGRPIQDHGFDFSLGYLKYAPGVVGGVVEYAGFVKQHCCSK